VPEKKSSEGEKDRVIIIAGGEAKSYDPSSGRIEEVHVRKPKPKKGWIAFLVGLGFVVYVAWGLPWELKAMLILVYLGFAGLFVNPPRWRTYH